MNTIESIKSGLLGVLRGYRCKIAIDGYNRVTANGVTIMLEHRPIGATSITQKTKDMERSIKLIIGSNSIVIDHTKNNKVLQEFLKSNLPWNN